MTNTITLPRATIQQAIEALQNEFDTDDWKIANATQILTEALAQPPKPIEWGKVRQITTDGRCLGWDGNEINTAS